MRSSISILALATLASSVFAAPERMNQVVKRASAPTDVEILNYALTLEHLEKNFYFQSLAKFKKADFLKAGYTAKDHARFQQIAIQEKAHVTFLAGALGDAGVHQCKYDFSAVTSIASFAAVARVLEGVGTAAYLGAAPDITTKAYLSAAGSILTVEARHSSYLNEFAGQSGFPQTFDSSLGYAQVYSLAAPFIIPGTCGASKALPSAIQAFPALTYLTKIPRSGHTSAIQFAETGAAQYYAAFISGGATTFRTIVKGEDGVFRVQVPKGLEGVVYTVVTSAKSLTDSNTVAGPAVSFV